MTRVLFCGDSAGTGFGTVTRDLGSELLRLGVEVRFLSLNEQPGGELDEPFVGRTAILGDPNGWLRPEPETRPKLEAMTSGGLFEDGWAPEAVIVLGDVTSLKISRVPEWIPAGFPAFHYVPIEGVGLPPAWARTWANLQPVAMCQFGADEIAKITGSRPPVVYHGVNTDDFYQVSPERPAYLRNTEGMHKIRTRDEAKRFLGIPRDTLVLYRADRNMPRKMYASMLRIVAPVLAKHPNAHMIWHCRTQDQGGDLNDERSKYGRLAERMSTTGIHDRWGGAPRELLNVFYNAADIYLSTGAEGFGLTIAEALACGTPVVGLDFSSVPEVIGPAGVVAPVGTLIDNGEAYFWARADEPAFSKIVSDLIADPVRRRLLGAKGPRHIREHFTWANAAAQFVELIEARVPSEVAV